MENDFERISVSSNDDKFSDASIKCLGGFIGAFLDLLEGGALWDKVEKFRRELFGSKGLSTLGDFLNQSIITIIVEKDYNHIAKLYVISAYHTSSKRALLQQHTMRHSMNLSHFYKASIWTNSHLSLIITPLMIKLRIPVGDKFEELEISE